MKKKTADSKASVPTEPKQEISAPSTSSTPTLVPQNQPETTSPYQVNQTNTETTVEQPTVNLSGTSATASTPVVAPPASPALTETADNATVNDFFSEEESGGGAGKKIFFVFLLALVIGALIVGGYFFLQSRKTQPEEKPTPTTAPIVSPEASPSASVEDGKESTQSATESELAEYAVQVLNGSGISGEAGVVKDLLVEAGFKDVATGNADSYDYTSTEVQVKKDVPNSVFTAIKDALSDYVVTEGNALSDNAKYDVVVIVGSEKQ
jgi:hypothetical protein